MTEEELKQYYEINKSELYDIKNGLGRGFIFCLVLIGIACILCVISMSL